MVEVLGREAASAVTGLEKTRWYDSSALQRLGLEPQRFLNARSGYLTRRLSGVPYVLGASLIYKLGLERGVVVQDHIDIMSLALALGNTSVFKLLHTRDDLFTTRVIQGYVVPLVPLEKFDELKLALGRRGALESRLKTATAPSTLPSGIAAADGTANEAYAQKPQESESYTPKSNNRNKVEEAAVSNIDKGSLMAALEQILDPRQLKIVVGRFGLEDGRVRTLEEIGREFGVTRESVRQLEAKAFKKLRKSEYFRREFGSLVGEVGPEVDTVADGYAAEPAPPYAPKGVPQEKAQKRRYNSRVAGSESPRTARRQRQPRSLDQNFHRNGNSEREGSLEGLEDIVKTADETLKGLYSNEFPDAFHQFMEYASHVPLLTKGKEQELLGKVREGNKEALDALLGANYRLVAHFALNLWNLAKPKTEGFELMDLVQEGVIGLRTAALHYRSEEAQARGFEKPFAFSTYATWWIKQAMDRTIKNTGRTIRLPVYIIEGRGKLNQAIKALARNGDTPSVEELVEATGMPESTVSRLLATNEPGVVSLDTVVSEEGGGGTFDYFISDESELGNVEGYVVSEIANGQLNETLSQTLSQILTPRELKIISDHFGLENNNPKTLEEVGKYFGISRERARQIEAKAIKRLRRSKKFRLLFGDNGTANAA